MIFENFILTQINKLTQLQLSDSIIVTTNTRQRQEVGKRDSFQEASGVGRTSTSPVYFSFTSTCIRTKTAKDTETCLVNGLYGGFK